MRRRVRCVDYPGGIEIIGERHQPGAVAGGDGADVVAALLQAGPAQHFPVGVPDQVLEQHEPRHRRRIVFLRRHRHPPCAPVVRASRHFPEILDHEGEVGTRATPAALAQVGDGQRAHAEAVPRDPVVDAVGQQLLDDVLRVGGAPFAVGDELE